MSDFRIRKPESHSRWAVLKKRFSLDQQRCECIGEGHARRVYTHPSNPTIVIKVALGMQGIRSNVIEQEVWFECQHTEFFAKWLAPVRWCSQDYKLLVMDRAMEVGVTVTAAPEFLKRSDLKTQNWGRIGEQNVCIDYGTIIMSAGWSAAPVPIRIGGSS